MTTLADIQRHLGITPDGLWGPVTAKAIADALGMSSAPHAFTDEPAFWAGVRKVTGPLDQVQVDTAKGIITAAAGWSTSWLAYGLATAWHEVRFKAQKEWGLGKGRPYAKPGARMKPVPITPMYNGQIPYGRGLVQLTWCDNYEWADKALGLGGKLLANFDLALDPAIAALILVKGMEEGAFTGKSLADYLPNRLGTPPQFKEARRIINGTDKAGDIAEQATWFQAAIEHGGWK